MDDADVAAEENSTGRECFICRTMFYFQYNVLFAVQCFISHWVGVMYRCTDNLCLKCPEKNKTKRQNKRKKKENVTVGEGKGAKGGGRQGKEEVENCWT